MINDCSCERSDREKSLHCRGADGYLPPQQCGNSLLWPVREYVKAFHFSWTHLCSIQNVHAKPGQPLSVFASKPQIVNQTKYLCQLPSYSLYFSKKANHALNPLNTV